MKDIILPILFGVIIFIGIFFIARENAKNYEPIAIKKDTIVITYPDYSLMKQNDSLCYVIDSLTNLNAKYEEELNIALFKIDRIKEYNRIAGNGNNIKYLRGWINRTLNE